jgi:hypothetical protein
MSGPTVGLYLFLSAAPGVDSSISVSTHSTSSLEVLIDTTVADWGRMEVSQAGRSWYANPIAARAEDVVPMLLSSRGSLKMRYTAITGDAVTYSFTWLPNQFRTAATTFYRRCGLPLPQ